ncbi:MAG TPA: GtrA family protein [Mycobacterium sp.]|nr:GtrA family protein [Mycobacterium sp.]
MKDAPSDAAVSLKGHAQRLHIGLRRPHNWLQLFRYCVVGASGYLINLGVYAAVYTHLPYRLAFTIAFIVAATSNFVWNRIWTFRVDHGTPHHQYARFLTVSAVALGIDLLVLTGLVEGLGLDKIVAAAIAIAIATPVSFLGNKLWSFSR